MPLSYPVRAGLPDGFFSDQKYKFWCIFEDLAMEKVVLYVL
jgi:hypothetical protein